LVTKEVVKGDKVLLEVSGVNHSGYGVGRYQGLAVFIPETLPGDKVIAVITTRKKNYAEAKILGIIQPAASRLEPRCGHYNVCGGCRLQHADYEEQLRLKTTLVRDSLRRIGRLGGVTVKDILGMENPWHYRNKVHFQIERHNGGYSLGYYEEGTHVLTDIFNDDRNSGEQGCLLVDKDLNRLALTIINLLNKYGKDVPGERFFRHLMLRKAFFTGETMAVLVTSGGDWPPERDFARELKRLHPELTSLLRNIKRDMSGEILGKEFTLLAGRDAIFDQLQDLTFRISAASFYQVNPLQTQVLYAKATEYAALTGKETVLDAYSGIGTIALYMSRQARQVYGVEIVPAAVEDARFNAELNKIGNAEFFTGKAEKVLPLLKDQGLQPDVIVLDPPRQGCDRVVLDAVLAMEVPRLVYVSCSPGTLARDLGYLAEKGYQVKEVQPVDMFPWTHHVECVTLMSRVKD